VHHVCHIILFSQYIEGRLTDSRSWWRLGNIFASDDAQWRQLVAEYSVSKVCRMWELCFEMYFWATTELFPGGFVRAGCDCDGCSVGYDGRSVWRECGYLDWRDLIVSRETQWRWQEFTVSHPGGVPCVGCQASCLASWLPSASNTGYSFTLVLHIITLWDAILRDFRQTLDGNGSELVKCCSDLE